MSFFSAVSGRRIGLAILGNGIMAVLSRCAGILFTFVGASVFEQEILGYVLMGVGLMMLASTLVSMGFPGSIPHFMTVGLVRKDNMYVYSPLRVGTSIVVAVGIIVASLLYFFSIPIATNLYNEPAAAQYFSWAAIGVPLLALSKLLTGALRGMDRTVVAAFIDSVLWRSFHLIIILGTLLFDYGSEGTIIGIAITPYLMVAVGVYYIREFLNQKFRNARLKLSKEVFSYTLNSWVTSVLTLLRSRGDIILMGFFVGSSKVAIFAVGATLASILLTTVNIIGPAYRPLATQLLEENRISELISYYIRIVRLNAVLIVPLAVYMALFAEPLVIHLFGLEYLESALVLKILLLGLLPRVIMGPVNPTLLALGLPDVVRRIDVMTTILFVLSLIAMASIWGIVGAAWAFGGAGLLQHALKNLVVRRYVPIPWVPNEGLFTFFGLVVLIGGASRVVEVLVLQQSNGWLIVMVPFFALVFVSAFITKQVSYIELNQILSLIKYRSSKLRNKG